MPAMNLRLVSPELIVDIGDLSELRGISVQGDLLRIGALTRHVELLKSPDIMAHAPLLTEAAGQIAHPAIRNRGTLGGSLAHADPAAELPACMLALDARIVVRGGAGERRIAAVDFFKGIFETALSPYELLVAAEIPRASRNSVHFFREFSRRHGDYALAGLAGQAVIEGGRFAALRMAFFAVGDRPVLSKSVERLVGVLVTAEDVSAASTALGEELDFHEDGQASIALRRHLVQVLLRQCVSELLRRPDLDARRIDA